MTTNYSNINQKFSDIAHVFSQEAIYPEWLKVERYKLSFKKISVSNSKPDSIESVMDGHLGIDRIIGIESEFNLPIEITVQERFRRPEKASFRDITITEWNNTTNLPSELYKLKAQYFVYSYFDPGESVFGETIVVNCGELIQAIARKEVNFLKKPNPRSNQEFIGIKIDELINKGVYSYHEEGCF